MKKIILLSFILTGCQFIKFTKSADRQSVEFSKVPASFELINNKILLKNGVNFYLDLGGPNIIFDSNSENIKVIDSTPIDYLNNLNRNIIISEIKNPFFTLKNGVFKSLNKNLKHSGVNGIIGPELFQNKIICIDFERNEIKIMPMKFDSSDYKQAEVVSFDGYYFKIKLKIKNEVLVAKLDTGNPYDLILKKNDYQKIKNKEELQLFDSICSIEIGTESSNQIIVKSNKSIKKNLIGIGFMKNYNWCMDYKNGKIYYKKIKDNHLKIANK